VKRTAIALMILSLPLLACNKSTPEPAPAPKAEPAKEKPAEAPKAAPAAEEAKAEGEAAKAEDKQAAAPAADGVQELAIESVGNEMAYNLKELKVKAGGKVKITLVNKATSEAMKHNIVIVKKGTSMKVGQAAISTMGVPPKTADVLAASDIAGPGKTVTLEFATPPAGEYEFVCTFPGHFAMMKGAFIVE
tara:strand:- start:6841 stop:7413 length:573 start_codon:yes stop_codon:yes gene_type:complete